MSSSQRTRLENSQSSQTSRADKLSDDQIEAAVLNVTAFLLCDMRSMRKIRKEDVVTNALNKSSKQYSTIMKKVQENLLNIFGLQIAKFLNSDDTFIIINKHREPFNKLTSQIASDIEVQDGLILTIVLSSIFMNRGQMFESHLMTILETIGFLNDKFYESSCERKMKDHVIKLVKQAFVKQMYLESSSIDRPEQAQNPPLPENDKKVTVYQWGYRAMLEVDVDRIVDYLRKIHEGGQPAAIPTTYYKELKNKQDFLRSRIA